MPYNSTSIKEATYPLRERIIFAQSTGGSWRPEHRLSHRPSPTWIQVCCCPPYQNALEHPAKWNDTGKQEVLQNLTELIKGQFELTQYDTIYGLGAIGLCWMVCKMERTRSSSHMPTNVVDWHDNIGGNQSYDAFKTVAELVHTGVVSFLFFYSCFNNPCRKGKYLFLWVTWLNLKLRCAASRGSRAVQCLLCLSVMIIDHKKLIYILQVLWFRNYKKSILDLECQEGP